MELLLSLCVLLSFSLCRCYQLLILTTSSKTYNQYAFTDIIQLNHDICDYVMFDSSIHKSFSISANENTNSMEMNLNLDDIRDSDGVIYPGGGIKLKTVFEMNNFSVIIVDQNIFCSLCGAINCLTKTLLLSSSDKIFVYSPYNFDQVTRADNVAHAKYVARDNHVTGFPEECRDVMTKPPPPRSFAERYSSIKQVLKYLIAVLVKEGPGRVRDLSLMFIRHGRLDILPCEMSRGMSPDHFPESRDAFAYISIYNIDVWCCVLVIIAILLGTAIYLTVIIILHILEKSRARSR